MGGSILPATLHNGKIYFLFGKERDIDENPGWSDFGGGTDKGETFMQTAIREGGEELTGFLGSNEDIKKMLNKYGTHNIDYKSKGYSTYRCHIFPMEYDHLLPFYYNNNQRFLQKKLDPKIIKNTKIFEKTQIKWFSFDDMKKQHNEFRSFYKNIVDLIIFNRLVIEKFVRTNLSSKKTLKQKNKSNVKRRITNKKTRKNKKY
jgi:8-oxo-dGTP pyrophosphatase MutT (NUDIX family)